MNALVALILLAPVPRWSADAGKALLIVAGLVTVLLASFLLVGGGFTWAHGVGRTAIVLVVCAAAQLAAGVLVFRAAFPRPPVHYAA